MIRNRWLFPAVATAGLLVAATGLVVTAWQRQDAETGKEVAVSELLDLAEKNKAACQRDPVEAAKILGSNVCQQAKEITERPEKGDPGAKGDQGEQGPKGEKGDKGDPGTPCVPQNPGCRGPRGQAGPTPACMLLASKCVGATGAKGEQGEQGEHGEKGDTGATGDTGAKGDTGDTGAKGDPGRGIARTECRTDGVLPTVDVPFTIVYTDGTEQTVAGSICRAGVPNQPGG